MNAIPAAGAILAAGLTLVALPALAHVTFETAEAPRGSTYKAVLQVPHGCADQATLSVEVDIPEGVIDVRPMPKAGWSLKTTISAYEKPQMLHGKPVMEGVSQIVWSGSLASDHFDEFVFRAHLSKALESGRSIAFPVVQTCANGTEEWTEIAAADQPHRKLKRPAPIVRIVSNSSAPQAFTQGSITVEQPWSRATPAGAKVGGGYLRVTNTGKEPDRLIGGTFPLATRVEIHEMSMTDNVMRMKQVADGVEIAPGQTVELKPGGYHLMFMDLREGLTDGQTVKGTLIFEKAGPIDVVYSVRSMAGHAPAGHQHH